MKIRAYDEQDRADVIALWQRCDLTRPWNDPGKDIARKLLVNPEMFLVGIDETNQLVATVMAGYEGHRGWINYLAVDPAHRRRGHARAMMEAAEILLRAAGCPKINLQVRAGNDEAIAFYARIGYGPDHAISLGKRLEHDGPRDDTTGQRHVPA